MKIKIKPIKKLEGYLIDFETILGIIENPAIGDYRKAHEIEKYLKQQTRLAVQGLTEEIFTEIKNATQIANDGNKDARKMGIAYIDGLNFSCRVIKKWFPDVLEEEERK